MLHIYNLTFPKKYLKVMLFRLTWSMPCSNFLSLVELYIWKTRISVLRWPSVTFFNIKLSIFTFVSLSPLRSLRHVGNLIMVYPGVHSNRRVPPLKINPLEQSPIMCVRFVIPRSFESTIPIDIPVNTKVNHFKLIILNHQ